MNVVLILILLLKAWKILTVSKPADSPFSTLNLLVIFKNLSVGTICLIVLLLWSLDHLMHHLAFHLWLSWLRTGSTTYEVHLKLLHNKIKAHTMLCTPWALNLAKGTLAGSKVMVESETSGCPKCVVLSKQYTVTLLIPWRIFQGGLLSEVVVSWLVLPWRTRASSPPRMSSVCGIFLWEGCFISHAVILDHDILVSPIQLDTEIPTITQYDREIHI